MRRLSLLLLVGLALIAAPGATYAAPFPAVSQKACDKAGGDYSVDKSVDPIVKTCLVSLGDGDVVLYHGSAPDYVVQVSSSDSVHWYIQSDGEKTDFIFPGAIGVTNCWFDGVPVPDFLIEPNCVPTTPI
jgi:hypothetical protein